MQKEAFPWKRLWCPRDQQINLSDDGFLVDPASDLAKYFPSAVLPFEMVAGKRCVVLLGEPGIGKSTALRAEFESLAPGVRANGGDCLWFDLRDFGSHDRLQRDLFGADDFKRWVSGNYELHLFLDSLDEGLLLVDNISRVLQNNLRTLPKERLFLRIASRPADWPATLEAGLSDIWGSNHVAVFEAAPLLKKDVMAAYSVEAGKLIPTDAVADAHRFLDTVIQKGVVPLASTPVTLTFLIRSYMTDGALQLSRSELYRAGCERLCEEVNRERREGPRMRGTLESGQRLAVASRIAAVTQLANRSAIWLGTLGEKPSEDVGAAHLVGGPEGSSSSLVTVDAAGVREVLNTGLFSSRGVERQGWAHQSYAEYLAAFYLASHRAPISRLRSILLTGDGSNRVIPQLREVAAWLALMDSNFLELLARFDPEALLRGDIAAGTELDRARLAERLLKASEKDALTTSVWQLRNYFRRLKNSKLPEIVGPYLTDTTGKQEARLAAVEIVRECELVECQAELARLALDATEPVLLRSRAAAAIAGFGAPEMRARVRPLNLQPCEADSDDELRGYALQGCWPDHITAGEIFSALTEPKSENYLGSYHRFLTSHFVDNMAAGDFEVALEWARSAQKSSRVTATLERLASKIIERAFEHLTVAGVMTLLAVVLFERGYVYSDDEGITSKLVLCTDDVRRSLARKMFVIAPSEPFAWLTVVRRGSLREADVTWLLAEYTTAANEVRSLIAGILSHLITGRDVEGFGALLSAAESDEVLWAAIHPRIRAIDLDSSEAADVRQDFEWARASEEAKKSNSTVFDRPALAAAVQSEDPDAFFRIQRVVLSSEQTPGLTDPLPRWSAISEEFQAGIMQSALRYLGTRPPALHGAWWKRRQFTYGQVAGFHAFRLLAMTNPSSLETLTAEDWNFWVPILLVLAPGEPAKVADLLKMAHAKSKALFEATLGDLIDAEDADHGQALVLARLEGIWSSDLADRLRAKIESGQLTQGGFRDVFGFLLRNGYVWARQWAVEFLRGFPAYSEKVRKKAAYAAAELLFMYPEEWNTVWPIVQADRQFGIDVFEALAMGHQYNGIALRLKEGQVGEICLWLSSVGLDARAGRVSGIVTPQVAVANWWNSLLNLLADKGTPEACITIRRLVEALPEVGGLPHLLRAAEEKERRLSWRPPSIETILNISTMNAAERLVLSVHGIRTRGAWQKEISSSLQRSGLIYQPLDFDHFRAVQLLIPYFRQKKID